MKSESEFKQEFQEAVTRGSQIDAVRVYREWKNVGFKDAARYVQANWKTLRALA